MTVKTRAMQVEQIRRWHERMDAIPRALRRNVDIDAHLDRGFLLDEIDRMLGRDQEESIQ